jgi:hypothetical protein
VAVSLPRADLAEARLGFKIWYFKVKRRRFFYENCRTARKIARIITVNVVIRKIPIGIPEHRKNQLFARVCQKKAGGLAHS